MKSTNEATSRLFYVSGRPSGSIAQCSHGKQEALGSSPDRATFFFCRCDIWWPEWVRARAARSKKKKNCLVGSDMVPISRGISNKSTKRLGS